LLERREGGRGSGNFPAGLPARRVGVLGMPGRCSQEKGTEEARSGERKRWWNGDGAGEKKERPEEEEPDDEDEVVVAEAPEVDDVGVVAEEEGGRSCLRRRRVAMEGAGGDGEEAGAGLGIALFLFLFLFPLGVECAEESGGCARVWWPCGAALRFAFMAGVGCGDDVVRDLNSAIF
jgi:hypothetical protein